MIENSCGTFLNYMYETHQTFFDDMGRRYEREQLYEQRFHVLGDRLFPPDSSKGLLNETLTNPLLEAERRMRENFRVCRCS